MKLGFIGTGNITVAVVNGICGSKISFRKILVSPRNKGKALKLSKKFKKVSIAKTNQEVIDKSNWVFLAITPKVGERIIPKLKFRSNQKIISFDRRGKYLIIKLTKDYIIVHLRMTGRIDIGIDAPKYTTVQFDFENNYIFLIPGENSSINSQFTSGLDLLNK